MTLPKTDEAAVEAVERDIRMAIWNGARWQGSPQEVAQSLIRKVMEEPSMIRTLAAMQSAPMGWRPIADPVADALDKALECWVQGREMTDAEGRAGTAALMAYHRLPPAPETPATEMEVGRG